MPVESPKNFTQEEVAMWLVATGMGDKVAVFKQNSVDGGLLVTLTTADLTGDLGFTNLQARKFLQNLEFTTNLSAGGGDTSALVAENQALKAQVAQLQRANQELQARLGGTAPPAQPAYHQQQAAAPPPKKNTGQGEVVKGAAGGALRGAAIGAIGGAIMGDPGQGAKMGAAMGGAGGAMNGIGRRRRMMR